jgi:hypothetical protein
MRVLRPTSWIPQFWFKRSGLVHCCQLQPTESRNELRSRLGHVGLTHHEMSNSTIHAPRAVTWPVHCSSHPRRVLQRVDPKNAPRATCGTRPGPVALRHCGVPSLANRLECHQGHELSLSQLLGYSTRCVGSCSSSTMSRFRATRERHPCVLPPPRATCRCNVPETPPRSCAFFAQLLGSLNKACEKQFPQQHVID